MLQTVVQNIDTICQNVRRNRSDQIDLNIMQYIKKIFKLWNILNTVN